LALKLSDTSFPANPRLLYYGNKKATVMGREKLLIQLRECGSCGFRFRYPKGKPEAAREYYESTYEGGHVTYLPDMTVLGTAREKILSIAGGIFPTKLLPPKPFIRGPGCSNLVVPGAMLSINSTRPGLTRPGLSFHGHAPRSDGKI